MLVVLWLCLIFAGIVKPKSKTLSIIMLGFMVIVVALRTQGADYTIYENEYRWSVYQAASDVHYVGYLLLEQCAHSLGLGFEVFKTIVGIVSCCLTWIGFRKLTENMNLALALYFVYPFAHEAVQARTFLANSIVIAALPFVLKQNQKDSQTKRNVKNILFFVLGGIACTFHFEAVFYIVVLGCVLLLPEKYNSTYVLTASAIAFLLIVSNILPVILSKFNTRIQYWVSSRTGLGIVFPIAITMLIWYLNHYILKKCLTKISGPEQGDYYKKSYRVNDYIFWLIPLFCYDITFNRMWRFFLVLLYASAGNLIYHRITQQQRKFISALLVLLLLVLAVYEGEMVLLHNLMENNALFRRLSVF